MILSITNTNNLRTCIGFVSLVAIPLLVISLIIILFYSITASLAFASDNTTVMRRLTNGSSLEVILAPLQKTPDDEMQFRVGFLKLNKNKLQEHVDFNFIILKNGKEVFSGSNHQSKPAAYYTDIK